MSDLNKVARPYAQAIFDIAKSSDQLSGWSKALATAAQVTEEETARRFLARPDIGPEKRASFVEDIVNEAIISNEMKSAVRVDVNNLPYGKDVRKKIEDEFPGAKGSEIAQKIRAEADKERTVILAEATKKSEILREREKVFIPKC